MAYRFRADGATGTVAIYEATDDNPFTSPLSYPSRVLFHSGLAYPARIATITGSLSLPARNAPGSAPFTRVGSAGYQIAAHGRAGIPAVEGKLIGIGTGGVDVPWVGTIPVQQAALGAWRWLTLGADATYVYVHEMWGTSAGVNIGSTSVSYEVHVLDKVF
jgi:hypothetical protein